MMLNTINDNIEIKPQIISKFCKGLTGVGRILEDEQHNVWGCSPIYGPDGKVHVFYSRWKNEATHLGWLSCCEIAHAIADKPEGPYKTVDIALKGRGGDWWDAMTCHNPTIHLVGDKYVLFYIGTSEGSIYSKRIGMATSDSLYGPWTRSEIPIIEPDLDPTAWNSMCTTNPAFLQHPNGELWLYYKSWSIADWELDLQEGGWQRSNRQYGLAIANKLAGPWIKQGDGPIINLRDNNGGTAQSEDAYIWIENGTFRMIMRDMGFWNHEYGLYFDSLDGKSWSQPKISFMNSLQYFNEKMTGLDREGRFERPQLLMRDGKPEYLFCAFRGGKYNTSSGAVLKISG